MNCKICGNNLPDNAVFCGQCGTRIERPAPVAEVPAPVVEAPAPVAEVPAPVVEVPAPVAEVPAPVAEVPAPVAEVPVPVAEVPVPVAEIPAPVAEVPAPEQPVPPMYGQPMEPTYGQPMPGYDPAMYGYAPPQKPRNLKWLKITGIIVAVLVLLGAAYFIFKDSIDSLFVKIQSPEKQLQYAYTHMLSDVGDELGDYYTMALTGSTEDAGMKGSMELELSKDLLSQLGMKDLPKVIMDYELGQQNGSQIAFKTTIKGNQTALFSVNMYMDMAENTMTLEMPGLVDGAVEVDLQGTEMELPSTGDMTSLMGMGDMLTGMLPEEDVMVDLFSDLAKVALEEITEVKESDATFTAGGVSEELTCLETTVDTELLSRMAVAVLEEVKVNPHVQKIIDNVNQSMGSLMSMMGGGVNLKTEFDKAIDEVIAQMKAIPGGNQTLFVLRTYVNSSIEIAAVEIDAGDTLIRFGEAKDGNKFGFECSVSAVSPTDKTKKTMVALIGSGTDADGDISGRFQLQAEGENMISITCTDFDVDGLTDGELDGAFEVTFGPKLLNEMGVNGLAFGVDVDGSDEELKMTWTVRMNGTTVATLRMTGKEANVSADAPIATTDDPGAWGASIDTKALEKKLEALGVPSEVMQALFGINTGDYPMILPETGQAVPYTSYTYGH